MPHGGAPLREHAEIVAERIVAPGVRGGEHAVADESAIVEKADVGEELDGRLAIFVHDALELHEVAARVRVHGHVQLARRVLAGAQQGLAARLDLGRVEHAAEPPLGGPFVLADEGDGVLQALRADTGVVIVIEAALGVREGVAIAEGRAAVDAHAQLVDQADVAFPVAALAPDVDDGGGSLPEGVEEDERAQGGHRLGRGRGHLALQGRGEAHVVRRPVVVLSHVEEEVVARVARRVDVGVDEAGGDELAPRREAGVGRPRVRASRVHDTVALEDDATLLVDLVALAVERDHPPAFDERSHDPTSSPLRAS